MTTYFSTRALKDIDIDIATCTIDAGLDYYASLFDRSDSHGAFPGSREWRRAEPYAKALAALIVARPDLDAARKQGQADQRTASLAGVDVLGI